MNTGDCVLVRYLDTGVQADGYIEAIDNDNNVTIGVDYPEDGSKPLWTITIESEGDDLWELAVNSTDPRWTEVAR